SSAEGHAPEFEWADGRGAPRVLLFTLRGQPRRTGEETDRRGVLFHPGYPRSAGRRRDAVLQDRQRRGYGGCPGEGGRQAAPLSQRGRPEPERRDGRLRAIRSGRELHVRNPESAGDAPQG